MLVEFKTCCGTRAFGGESGSREELLLDWIMTTSIYPCYDLSGTDLRGMSVAGLPIPHVEDVDAKILAEIEAYPQSFDMRAYHSPCRTTHCRAGWAVVLAGEAGRDLEDRFGSRIAGTLIYCASRPGKSIPDFIAVDCEALADLRKCAAAKL